MIQKEILDNMRNDNSIILGRPSHEKYDTLLIPYISRMISFGESFIVTDPENILLPRIGSLLKKEGYIINSINLRYPNQSNSWNPLFTPYYAFKNGNVDLCLKLLNDMATNIMTDYSLGKNDDPFWVMSSIDLFVGLALVLFKEANDVEQVNLKSIYKMAQKGFDRFGSSTIINEYFLKLSKNFDIAESAISPVSAAPNDTRNSILSVFFQKLRSLTSNDEFMCNLSSNDFSIEELLEHKSAIFICYEDEKTTNISFVNIFVKQVFELLIQKRTANKIDYKRYNIIFNSFLSLGSFPGIERMLISSSNRFVNIILDINSINLLNKLYGNDTSAFILSFCSTWVITTSRETEILRQVESLIRLWKQEELIIKSPFELTDREAMVIRDGEIPEILILQDSTETISDYSHQVMKLDKSTIKVFKIDEYVKNSIKMELFNQIDPSIVPSDVDNRLNLDELVSKIDQKIAELEVKEKFDRMKESLK